jgi:hypothetical protein
MLQFNKNNVSFTVSNDGLLVVSTKLIDAKGYRLISELDGTIGSLAKAINRISNFSNDDYKTYSTIQMATMSETN